MKLKRTLRICLLGFVVIVIAGLITPEQLAIPVEGATPSDWNHQTFWHEPWGSSGVHKGIDIFGKKGTPALSASHGIVVFSGELGKGGNAVAVLGPKWRIHYFAHLQSRSVKVGKFVQLGSTIGTLGDTGNAVGKPPHVHYSILSLVPLFWRSTLESQGWKKMFFLNPHEQLTGQEQRPIH